jgi:hypothetical protein
MHPTARKIIAVAASAFLVWVAYYGSYLPLRKGQRFIETTAGLNQAHSLADFEAAMSSVLDAPSPIGQEELVRNVANMVLTVVQSNGENAGLTEEALSYLNRYYDPIVSRGRGMSFEQDLYLLGIINETAAMKTRDVRYLAAAERYFILGNELGPKRPQPLRGLLDVYVLGNTIPKAKDVVRQILALWPDDERAKTILAQLERASSAAPSASGTPTE